MKPVRVVYAFLSAVLCAALVSCGGGDPSPPEGASSSSPRKEFAAARVATVDPSVCEQRAGHDKPSGECLELSAVLPQIAVNQPEFAEAQPPQSAEAYAPQAASLLSASEFFGWAQAAYPAYFGGSYVQDSAFVPGYGTFLFRYYSRTGNYLAVLGDYAYVHGPMSAWSITSVGRVDDFYCNVYRCDTLVVDSRINGEFTGWQGSTLFSFTNGQVWQQASYAYTYTYMYMPRVRVYQTSTGYEMLVDGMSSRLQVVRLR